MSDAYTKNEKSKAKDLRQGVTEQKPALQTKKKKKSKEFGIRMTILGIVRNSYFPNEVARDKAFEAWKKKGYGRVEIIEKDKK